MPTIEDFFQRAVAALASGDLKRAEQFTQELLTQDPENIDALSLLANIFQQGGKLEKALEPAKLATELAPDNLQAWNTLGHLYLLLERWSDGEKCYARAITITHAPPTIFLNYAWALIELDKEAAAIKQLRQAIEKSLEDELINMIQTNPHYTKLRPLLKKIK